MTSAAIRRGAFSIGIAGKGAKRFTDSPCFIVFIEGESFVAFANIRSNASSIDTFMLAMWFANVHGNVRKFVADDAVADVRCYTDTHYTRLIADRFAITFVDWFVSYVARANVGSCTCSEETILFAFWNTIERIVNIQFVIVVAAAGVWFDAPAVDTFAFANRIAHLRFV